MTCLEILTVSSLSDSVQPSDVRGGGQPLSATSSSIMIILDLLLMTSCCRQSIDTYSPKSYPPKDVIMRASS